MEKQKFQIRGFGFRSEETLLDDRQSLVSPRTCNFRIGRDWPPTQALQTVSLGLRFDGVARFVCLTGRQKDHAEPVDRGQLHARLTSLFANQFVWDASEQAGAVTASSVGVHPSTVRQPDQSLQRAVNDLARSSTADFGDQADTAGVVVCG
jgi:hypothetical protein